ncbi:MAG TPA: hypothetical protein VMF65_15975 [Acidimicrobiales bacterium]|nr:hypothetical protein [Acidimicrobiales bacterium]
MSLSLHVATWPVHQDEPSHEQVLAVVGRGRFNGPVGDVVGLRPIEDRDIDGLLRFFTEPGLAGEFQWFVLRAQHALDLRRRLGAGPSFRRGVVPCRLARGWLRAGWVNWRPGGWYGNSEIGIAGGTASCTGSSVTTSIR